MEFFDFFAIFKGSIYLQSTPNSLASKILILI